MRVSRPNAVLVAAVAGSAAALVLVLTPGAARAQSPRYQPVPKLGAPRSGIGVWLGPSNTVGALVTQVAGGSSAAQAGLVAGERVVSANGISLQADPADGDDPVVASAPARRWARVAGRLAPGIEVELRVADRAGRPRVVRLPTVAPTALGGRWSTRTGGGDPLVRGRWYGDAGIGNVPVSAAAIAAFWFSVARPRRPLDSAALRARPGQPAQAYFTFKPLDTLQLRVAREAAQAPALGLTVAPTGTARDTLGLFVAGVVTDGPADSAGAVEGDRVAAIGDVDVRADAVYRAGYGGAANGL